MLSKPASESIQVRMPKLLKTRLETVAKRANMPLSSYLRDLAKASVDGLVVASGTVVTAENQSNNSAILNEICTQMCSLENAIEHVVLTQKSSAKLLSDRLAMIENILLSLAIVSDETELHSPSSSLISKI